MLKVENLVKNFQDKKVIDHLNLEVQDSSIFGLVGVNGAGKSTLLRLIAGVYEPEEGTITLNGKNTWSDVMVRKQIAFVSDEMYYPTAATINSMKLLYEELYDFDEDAYQKYLKLFELDPAKPIARFSKGMKRKVSLLFALTIHPKLILLDEAYDGLEPIARLRFKNALTDRIEDECISVVISSHNLKELEDICDSFGILSGGRITSYGDLLNSRDQINKYQLAFDEPKTKDDFKDFQVLHYEQEGKIYKLIIKGDAQQVQQRLTAMHPIVLNVLPVSFEELFIYEVENGGMDHE